MANRPMAHLPDRPIEDIDEDGQIGLLLGIVKREAEEGEIMVLSPVSQGEIYTEGGDEKMVREGVSPEKHVSSQENIGADTDVFQRVFRARKVANEAGLMRVVEIRGLPTDFLHSPRSWKTVREALHPVLNNVRGKLFDSKEVASNVLKCLLSSFRMSERVNLQSPAKLGNLVV